MTSTNYFTTLFLFLLLGVPYSLIMGALLYVPVAAVCYIFSTDVSFLTVVYVAYGLWAVNGEMKFSRSSRYGGVSFTETWSIWRGFH